MMLPWPLAPLLKPGPIGAGLLEEVPSSRRPGQAVPLHLPWVPTTNRSGESQERWTLPPGSVSCAVTFRSLFCPSCFLLPSSRTQKPLVGPPDSSAPIQEAGKAFSQIQMVKLKAPSSDGIGEGPAASSLPASMRSAHRLFSVLSGKLCSWKGAPGMK